MYGLIGRKLGHSFSADFFNKKFKEEGINEEYRLFPLENIEDLSGLLSRYPDLKGLNVTIPYKEQVIPMLSSVSDDVKKIGAVNVIKISRVNDKCILNGFNTDTYGFRISLLPLLNPDIKNALILGTGGASKAVEFVLKDLGLNVTFVSRRKNNSSVLTYSEIDESIVARNLLVVNTTPLGMFPDIDSCPDFPYHYLTKKHICFDLVYNPLETKFMICSSKFGATTKNGLEMLHLQAIAAWEIWND